MPDADDLDRWMRKRFLVDDATLADNRRGVLTPAQRKHVRDATGSDWTFMAGLSVVFWIVMGGVFAMVRSSNHPELATEVWFLALVFVWPVAATAWTIHALRLHLKATGVASLHEGPVKKRALRGRQAQLFSLNVGDGWLDVSEDVFDAVTEGSELRIYAAEPSRVVVFIESLRERLAT